MHEATTWRYRRRSCRCPPRREAGLGAILSGPPPPPSQSRLAHADPLRPEDVHGPYNILPADGALAHPLPAFGTGYHVTALQQHAVDDGVHADSTQVLIGCQLSLDTICWGGEQIFFFSSFTQSCFFLIQREDQYSCCGRMGES